MLAVFLLRTEMEGLKRGKPLIFVYILIFKMSVKSIYAHVLLLKNI